jgi:hypothetical protein
MTKDQRQDVQESERIIEGSWDTMKIVDLISILQELFLKGFNDVELDVDHSYYDQVRPFMEVTRIRKETDIEYNERIKKQQMAEAARERAQRLEYEKLRKKFGDA